MLGRTLPPPPGLTPLRPIQLRPTGQAPPHRQQQQQSQQSQQSPPSPSPTAVAASVAAVATDSKVVPFVKKVYEMVNDPTLRPLISWSHEHRATAFVVWQPVEFSARVLPRFFKHSNFPSFVRQLNNYGFHKVESREGEAFSHKHFRRQRPDLLKLIQRRRQSRMLESSSDSEAEQLLQDDFDPDAELYDPPPPSLPLPPPPPQAQPLPAVDPLPLPLPLPPLKRPASLQRQSEPSHESNGVSTLALAAASMLQADYDSDASVSVKTSADEVLPPAKMHGLMMEIARLQAQSEELQSISRTFQEELVASQGAERRIFQELQVVSSSLKQLVGAGHAPLAQLSADLQQTLAAQSMQMLLQHSQSEMQQQQQQQPQKLHSIQSLLSAESSASAAERPATPPPAAIHWLLKHP